MLFLPLFKAGLILDLLLKTLDNDLKRGVGTDLEPLALERDRVTEGWVAGW